MYYTWTKDAQQWGPNNSQQIDIHKGWMCIQIATQWQCPRFTDFCVDL